MKKDNSTHPEMLNAFVDDDFKKMKSLISAGLANVNDCDPRRKSFTTPLMRCAINDDNHEMLKWLLENGADVNKKDGAGWTALHFACEYKSIESIKSLIQGGADVNSKNNLGATPLLRLFADFNEKNKDAFLIMTKAGADPKIKNNSGVSAFDIADDEIHGYLNN
ncbi:ankyrin repeat domain-containing protein [Acidovorax sp. SUPP3334]|uniref:ankyrin repeat domain-containing protein n=1 Tax=Acidovorax sp. SUPP3334 TaxID=2920881 RepID=UPI0023DE6102|nr:ankyrin repeat domain-containing protein [Acidovorax sp. SUPP3334]GKT27072.1 hypothetical protein AVHM3334_22720 [Acidovorax sp. SUPP3334]